MGEKLEKLDFKKIGTKELERLVRHHNHLYFVEKSPVISDIEFDRLVEELKNRKPDSKVLREIGSDLTEGSQKIRHDVLMLSLDKAYDIKTMENWASKFEGEIVVTPKVDGCAVSIRYGKDGTLIEAATRGSGTEGELITKNVMEISDIPSSVNVPGAEVRGEIYMPLSVFKKYDAEFANPRNLAAGAIKQKDPQKTAEYNLSFWAYDILNVQASTERQKLEILKRNNFPVPEWKVIKAGRIQEIFNYYYEKRNSFDFETDGVVYKADNVSEQIRLGVTAHHPRYAIAYKFQGDAGETYITDVEWSVSRTGVITPVGIVQPVELSGATVTRASLHNYGLMKKLGLTRGARVLMMRRGGVIPNLEGVMEAGEGEFEPPETCPSCGARTKVLDDFLYCTNKKGCMKAKISQLEHFIKTIECDGFGEKLIAKLYEAQLIVDPADFYRLTKEDLMKFERMGDVLAEKLIRNINSKRSLNLDVFLRSLGVKELGRHASEILSEKYGTLKRVMLATKEELSAIHTIGDVIAENIVKGLKNDTVLINKLLKEVKIVPFRAAETKGPLSGKKFLFTGTMTSMDRKEAQRIVKEMGGSAAASIAMDVDYLVVGDGGGAGYKLDRANKMAEKGAGIKIVTESGFLRMIGKNAKQ